MSFSIVDHGEFAFSDGGTANSSTGHDVVLPGGGSALAGDFDVLFVGSDTTVNTPSAFDVYSTFVGNQGGYLYVRRCAAATIKKDQTGFTAVTTSAASATVDITAAAVGTMVYAWVVLGVNTSAAVSSTGWTSVLNAVEGTSCRYALLRKRKAVGDTTFTFSWTTSTKGTIVWTSYFGVDPTTPDENATLVTNGTTSRTAVPTSSQTPSAATRTALACYGVRTTNSANKPITWTADAALVERIDADNNTAAANPWCGATMADSNGPVTQAAHSYTGTHNFAESHDGAAILYLIPAAAETATVRISTNGDNNTVALWSRVRGALSPDVAVNAHIDSNGASTNPTLSTGTLAANTEAIFVASTNTDMQAGTPTGATWSGTYTGLGTATTGSGASGIWGAHAWNTPVGTASESPSVSWTNGMRNRYAFAITFTLDTSGGSTVSDVGLPSSEQFGANALQAGTGTITDVGLPSSEQFGSGSLVPILADSGLPSSEQFGASLLVPTIQDAGLGSGEQFGASAVQPGVATIQDVGFKSQEQFGASSLQPGTVTANDLGLPSSEQFGATALSSGPITISDVGLPSQERFGAATLVIGAAGISGGAISSQEQFGASSLVGGPVTVTDVGLPSSEQFGSSSLAAGPVSVTAASVASQEQFGASSLSASAAILSGGAITSGEQFGASSLTGATAQLPISSIMSAERFGETKLVLQPDLVLASGSVASTEQFGASVIRTPTDEQIPALSVRSEERWGASGIFSSTRPADFEIRMDRKVYNIDMTPNSFKVRVDRRTINIQME